MKVKFLSLLSLSLMQQPEKARADDTSILQKCLKTSDQASGLPIGELTSNSDFLLENMTLEHRFFEAYFCQDPKGQDRLTGIQLVLKNPNNPDSRLQLNPIGPMLGECNALEVENEGLHIDAIRANHSKVGITSVKLALNGKAGNFGAAEDVSDD